MNNTISDVVQHDSDLVTLSHNPRVDDFNVEIDLLRTQLELYDRALNATSTHFAIVRYILPATGEVVYCNRAIAEHYGYTPSEMIGMNFMQSILRLSSERQVEIVETLAAGSEVAMENEVSRKDGSAFWIGITVRPLFDRGGRLTHFLSVGADITRRREEALKKNELQEQLITQMRERERMATELGLAQKLESVGRLAAGLAHEINTPIQYVGDSVYFIRDAYQDINRYLSTAREIIQALPAEAIDSTVRNSFDELARNIDYEFLQAEFPKAIERISEGAERVAGIVRAMKEFAHPGGAEHIAADINHALQTTLVVATSEYKYVATVHTHYAELPLVICNIGELNQVFLNMIVNAAHAIHDSGKDVSSGEIHIYTEMADNYVNVRIIDNGCGIPIEHLDKIYDPFFTTKEVGRGTGQGLSITRSIIVDKHGGQVNVNSNTGAGTEFILKLPINGRQGGKVMA